MKTIAVANQKGGVGKTTVARNLAFYAIERGLRVLCVDFDPQMNFTRTFRDVRETNFGNRGEDEIALVATSLFEPELSVLKPLACNETAGLIAATRGLSGVLEPEYENDELLQAAVSQPCQWLKSFSDEYDVCVVDTPPTLGPQLYAALVAADFVVCPCTMNQDAIDGLEALFHDINRVRDMGWNYNLVSLGLLANRINTRRAFHRNALNSLRDALGSGVMESVLYDRAATEYATDRPVWRIQSGESQILAAKEMKAVCAEILEKAAV